MKEKRFLKDFGKWLQSLRKSKKLSQEMLAELTALHSTHISKMERGVINPSLVNLYKISKAFNMTLSDMFHIPSKKEKEKEIIISTVSALLRKQNTKIVRSIENFISDILKFVKSK